MKANPGGSLDPRHVYGRDALIEIIWDRLDSQSVFLNAELRLLRSMDADQYLSRDTDGGYRFRFLLIRRWWKLDRGLWIIPI